MEPTRFIWLSFYLGKRKTDMREMRRTDRKLSAGETEEILVNGEYGVLSVSVK